jgi:hypothetical protein
MPANQSARIATVTIGGKDFTPCLKSFQGSDNHLDQSGLISFTGEIVLGKAIGFNVNLDDRQNIQDFCRGNAVIINVGGQRHPRGSLRVMGSRYDSDRQELTVQLGDLIALLNFKEPTDPDDTGIVTGEDKSIGEVIANLAARAGIEGVSGDMPDNTVNCPLNFSGSYLQSIGRILYAHGCFAWIDSEENFRVERIGFSPSNGVSIKVGKDEIWYRRLAGSEQPCAVIKAAGTSKVLRPYPKTRSYKGETYGTASVVDGGVSNYTIVIEQIERNETWDEESKELKIVTWTKKPIGLVVPIEVLDAIYGENGIGVTALTDYEYKEEYFYYDKD